MDNSKSDMNAIIIQLEEISNLLLQISENPQMFINNYKQWIDQRKQTISSFKEIKESVQNINVNCNKAKAATEGMVLCGSVAGCGGYLLSQNENFKELGENIAVCGASVAIIGGAGRCGSEILDTLLSEKQFDKAKEHLKQDEDSTAKLFPFLQNSKKLNELLNIVFGCDLSSNAWQEIVIIFEKLMLIEEFTDIEKIFFSNDQNCCSNVVHRVKENYGIDLEELSKKVQCMNNKTQFLLLIREFCTNSRVRESVQNFFDSYVQSPEIYKITAIGSKINLNFSMFRNINLYPIILSAVTETAMLIPNATFQCVLKAIDVSIRVFNFLSAVKDIKSKKSEYYKLLENTEVVLEEELTIVENACSQLDIKNVQ